VPEIFLVRHGEAEQQWGGVNPDPGLSVEGLDQARSCVNFFREQRPLKVLVSPRSRAQQTAEPLMDFWSVKGETVKQFDEIPTLPDIADRREWLLGVLGSQWASQPEIIQQWRQAIMQRLLLIDEPTVIFTHFMVINVVVSQLMQDPRCCVFQPACGSVTHLLLEGGELTLLEQGLEAVSLVN
jgi:broad specificity phosphatase PhoE